jgi:hypothetical protein
MNASAGYFVMICFFGGALDVEAAGEIANVS